jgi:hypothetical protein
MSKSEKQVQELVMINGVLMQRTPCQQQQGSAEEAAAEKAAADKAAADKAAADKAAADKAAAEKEAADKAAAEKAAAEKAKGGAGPTDAEAKLLKEVMKAKDTLKEKDAALAQATERLKEFDGVDPAEIKKLLAERKTAEEQQLAAKGDWDRLKKNMADEHTKEKTTLETQIAALQAENAKKDGVIGDMSIGQKFTSSKFITDELTLTPSKARRIYGDHFDVQEDGSVIGFDKPRGAAGRTQIVDSMGNPQAFDDVLRKLIDTDPEKDFLLRSKARPGAGSKSAPGNGAQPNPAKGHDEQSAVSKIAAGLKGLAKPLV